MDEYTRLLAKKGEDFICAFCNNGKCTIHNERQCKEKTLCNEMLYSICYKLYELEQILSGDTKKGE